MLAAKIIMVSTWETAFRITLIPTMSSNWQQVSVLILSSFYTTITESDEELLVFNTKF